MAAAYKATACLSSSKVIFKISSLPSSEERQLKQPVRNYALQHKQGLVQTTNSGRKNTKQF